VPTTRDALEAAARKRGWATERIHDSDIFCRLVIRSDAADVVTDAPAEVAGYMAMADAQPTAERRMRAARQWRY
jgi:hypothetical protein